MTGAQTDGAAENYWSLVGDLALWRNEIDERERRARADYLQSGTIAAKYAWARLVRAARLERERRASGSAKVADYNATFERERRAGGSAQVADHYATLERAAVTGPSSAGAEAVDLPEQIERRRRDTEQGRRRDVAVFHREIRRLVVLDQIKMRTRAGRTRRRVALIAGTRWIYLYLPLAIASAGTVIIAAGVHDYLPHARIDGATLIATAALMMIASLAAARLR